MAGHRSADPAPVGVLSGLGAFLIWGFAALYFKAVGFASPLEILAHRVIWSALLLWAVLALLRRGQGGLLGGLRGRQRALCVLTAALVSANWLIFIGAIATEHIVEASLGYYINPLVNVILGVLFLRERLSRLQVAAVAVAAVGVVWFVASAGGASLWISFALALTFGAYGLLRKRGQTEPLPGLFFETVLLAPLALGYLLWLEGNGTGTFGHQGVGPSLLLVLAGPVTAVPLFLFLVGAARLKLSTVGLMQYLAPSCQLLLGVLVYKEPFTPAHGVVFAAVWLALTLYSLDAFLARRSLPSLPSRA